MHVLCGNVLSCRSVLVRHIFLTENICIKLLDNECVLSVYIAVGIHITICKSLIIKRILLGVY